MQDLKSLGEKRIESEDYAKERRRHRRFIKLIGPPVLKWMNKYFKMELETFDPAEGEPPAIIATNHASVYDFLFVFAACRKRELAYVISEHVLRVRPWGPLLDRYCSLIPHRKGARVSRTAVKILERLRLGESVYLAVEGEQTWNGISMEIKPGTGKLAKKSGAALITYRLEGSYLIRPRWARNLRRGTVRGRVVNYYSPETLAGMSAEEIDDAISRDLYFDVWEWQNEVNIKKLNYIPVKGEPADGLSKALCSCPNCGRIGGLRDNEYGISCRCGFRAVFEMSGFIRKENGKCPKTIADWDKLDEKAIAAAIDKARGDGAEIFSDSGVFLYEIQSDHHEEELCKGRISLESEGGRILLRTGHESFDVAGIYDMTMVQADRLLFSTDESYYEIRSDEVNLRKYMTAYTIINTPAESQKDKKRKKE